MQPKQRSNTDIIVIDQKTELSSGHRLQAQPLLTISDLTPPPSSPINETSENCERATDPTNDESQPTDTFDILMEVQRELEENQQRLKEDQIRIENLQQEKEDKDKLHAQEIKQLRNAVSIWKALAEARARRSFNAEETIDKLEEELRKRDREKARLNYKVGQQRSDLYGQQIANGLLEYRDAQWKGLCVRQAKVIQQLGEQATINDAIDCSQEASSTTSVMITNKKRKRVKSRSPALEPSNATHQREKEAPLTRPSDELPDDRYPRMTLPSDFFKCDLDSDSDSSYEDNLEDEDLSSSASDYERASTRKFKLASDKFGSWDPKRTLRNLNG
nr:uncharacterized protein CI109_006502 [Kwoniella shandongensis]KAA5525132.1 hypothetical protein CI109_006502 [Kwoniella shandongensis]